VPGGSRLTLGDRDVIELFGVHTMRIPVKTGETGRN
jgi:hypothetical protein